MTFNLAQHAQGYIDCGQQRSKWRCHIRVKRWSGEAEHKQGSVFSQIHTLAEVGGGGREIIIVFISMYSLITFRMKVHRNKKGHWTTTWSKRIWQQSGVKCCRVASVLLRIFSRLHCTASRAFCSASSLPVSPPPAGFLDGVCGGRCALGSGPGGNASPFLTWKITEDKLCTFPLVL